VRGLIAVRIKVAFSHKIFCVSLHMSVLEVSL